MIIDEIQKRLIESCDEKYRQFHSKLMPEIDIGKIIGVRTPAVHSLAKEFAKRNDINDFLSALPHRYYEEYNLHGFIIAYMKDYDCVIRHIDRLLPYVDNWATCDMLRPAVFSKNRERLGFDIDRWLLSDSAYAVRFALEMIMVHFLDECFDVSFLEKAAVIRSDEYYINMMTAWLFATALAKQWDSTVIFLQNRRLDTWVHNKTIQKAVESYRITQQQKEYLRTLRIKKEKTVDNL